MIFKRRNPNQHHQVHDFNEVDLLQVDGSVSTDNFSGPYGTVLLQVKYKVNVLLVRDLRNDGLQSWVSYPNLNLSNTDQLSFVF